MALMWIVTPGSWPSYRNVPIVLTKDVDVDHAARVLFPGPLVENQNIESLKCACSTSLERLMRSFSKVM